MQVTAPKPVIVPDRVPTAAEKIMETNKPEEVELKDLVHRVQGTIKEESNQQGETYQFPDPEESIAMKELMNHISQSQQGLVIAEKIEYGLFSIFEAVGIARSKKGIDPEKARQFRENIAKQADEVSRKLKEMQLYALFANDEEKRDEESNAATANFAQYLQEGLGFLKQAEKVDTRQQLKEFDEKMKQKLEQIRRFKELLAKEIQKNQEAAKQLMDSIQEKQDQNGDKKTPLEVVKETAKEILNSLIDPTLLHENLSHIRTAYYLSDDQE